MPKRRSEQPCAVFMRKARSTARFGGHFSKTIAMIETIVLMIANAMVIFLAWRASVVAEAAERAEAVAAAAAALAIEAAFSVRTKSLSASQAETKANVL